MIFRAIWPVVDESQSWRQLCRTAERDLPDLIAQARAKVTAPGRFSIHPSDRVPGSGRVTESVRVYEAPAVSMRSRPYWKASA